MSTWQVTKRLTGEVIHAYGADAPDHLTTYPFDTYNHNRVPETAPIIVRRVSALQFRDLFSTAEKVAIEFAAIDDPSAAQEARLQAAGLRVFLADVESATQEQDGTSIDLDDPRTVAGVNALEAYGLIASGRAAEILSGNGL